MKQFRFATTCILLASMLLNSCKSPDTEGDVHQADLLIYGGTSAAVIAAVQAVKMQKSVIIVSPDRHLGGLSSSGLGYTDTGDKAVIGGLSREFYHRLFLHYQQEENWTWEKQSEYGNVGQGNVALDGEFRTMWIFEPSAAEKVFEDFIKEYEIPVFREEWLDREKGVEMKEGRIVSLRCLSEKSFHGKIFLDATYEGDLMAAAGVSYHVGREGNEVYGEEFNGVQKEVFHHGHHFRSPVSPYVVPGDPESGLVWGVSAEDPGEQGAGDSRIQAYCFRTCLTKHPENRVAFTRPADYDSLRYELLARVYESGWDETFNKFDPIPNAKTDVNNHGPFSFDNIGMNYGYPEGSYEERAAIVEAHRSYQQGLLWFLASDPRVPEEVRAEMALWGYSRDEFTDNGHWPHQIYVREARRMAGEFVMTENELLGRSDVPKPIGMGSYTMDSHNVQRYITPEGHVQNEGDIGVHLPPYQIDLGSILPREEECRNLLVPVAVSSSHIAFGSIRMEPVFMILGQSAGTLAGLALEQEADLHHVRFGDLRQVLEEDGQVLEYPGEKH